jgi:ferritin
MLSPKLQGALNDQINAELGSAYTYLAMAAYLEASNLTGSALWMRRQAREEITHAMKIFDFVNDRDGRVVLKTIPEPQAEFSTTDEIWELSLKQEQTVSARIHALYALAAQEKDYATQTMLQWFVAEQVEEEKTVRTILEQVKKIGSSSSAIYFLDRHLGKDAEAKE